MSIVVTKRSAEVVCPSEAGTPTGDIQLSPFDKAIASFPVSSLLVFDNPIQDPVESIKRALSRALVQYYPISGRLAAGADGVGGEVITCIRNGQGQGVLFVGASASCAVSDVLSTATALLNDLFVHYPEEFGCSPADPLLLMQVTEFSCGGFVVGLTWNHVLADGVGMGQFIQAVGELARPGGGMSLRPSVVPVRSGESVMAAHPAGITANDFASCEPTSDMAFLDLTIPWSLISHVKEDVSSCTTFEAAVAVLWQCRARAVSSYDPNSPAMLTFSSNVRDLVGAPGGYYGNCFVVESVVSTSAEVANGDIKDVVKLIRSVKRKIQDQIKNGQHAVAPLPLLIGYNTLMVSSWRNLGLEVADFGGGRPARVMWYASQGFIPYVTLCPPCKGNNDVGVNMMGYIVKKEHVDAFLHELAAVEFAPRDD